MGGTTENILISNDYPAHLDALLGKLGDSNAHGRVLGYLVTRALLDRLSGENQTDTAHRILQAMELEQLTGLLNSPDDFNDVSYFEWYTETMTSTNGPTAFTPRKPDKKCGSQTK